jgi:hypothetical protein
MNTSTTSPALTPGNRVTIAKGCKAREVNKGVTALVKSVTPLGPEYSHQVRVTIQLLNGFLAGRNLSFYARHPNRLSDAVVRMNDGNPLHVIEVCRA